MTSLDVSFGIFAFLPPGWIFMLFVILCEGCLSAIMLTKKKFHTRIYLTELASNTVSGVIGILLSLSINGGWWLVVWFPWVSSNEINIHNTSQLIYLVIYYVAAFVLTIVIELAINIFCLKKQFCIREIVRATLVSNAVTYFVGAILILFFISYSF